MHVSPSNNVNIIPPLHMLVKEVNAKEMRTVVEYSSGSTIISLAVVSYINHGMQDVCAILTQQRRLRQSSG
jgi:cysteine synthase